MEHLPKAAPGDEIAPNSLGESQTFEPAQQQPTGGKHERRSTMTGINSRTSLKTTIPHEYQVVDRILSLFNDPALIMRFSFEMKSNPNVPFYRQGDVSMIQGGEKESRRKIIQNRAFRRATDRFWDLFKFKDVRYGVSREQYVEFHQLVSRTMRSDSHDVTQTQGVAARDWLHDCSSNHGIQLDAWRESMFELVDLWEIGTDPASYVTFLETLLPRIAEPVSPLSIHKAIAKNWKPSIIATNGRMLRWALANVELKFRTLKDVPKAKLDPSGPSLYSADTEYREDQDHPNEMLNRNLGNIDTSQPITSQVDDQVLTRLEQFLAEDTLSEISSEDTIVNNVKMLEESRARFAACMQKSSLSMQLSFENCNRGTGLSSGAQHVRKLFESSAACRTRETERPEYSEPVRQAVDDLNWDILTRNGFVESVLQNDMLPRIGRIWNSQIESNNKRLD